MDLDVRHLRLVAGIADAGSMTKAAVQLHLTQSALSHQLRDIEAKLATPLFLRVGKRMALTPAGERVLQSAIEILASIGRTEDAVRTLSGAGRGLLRVSTECYTCYHWLPPLLKRYRKSHPRIDVRIEPDATSDPIAHLIDGTLDVAIVSDPVKDRRIVTSKLFDDEMVAILPPSHPLVRRPYLRPEDFAGETLLTYSPKEGSTFYQRVLMPAGVAAHVQQVQITEAIIELVKAGMGVAVLAWWAVEPAVRSGVLRAVPVTRRGSRRTWSAATLKDMARVPHVREFIDLVAERPPFRQCTPARRAPRRSRPAVAAAS